VPIGLILKFTKSKGRVKEHLDFKDCKVQAKEFSIKVHIFFLFSKFSLETYYDILQQKKIDYENLSSSIETEKARLPLGKRPPKHKFS
jgi:hypothetical protein